MYVTLADMNQSLYAKIVDTNRSYNNFPSFLYRKTAVKGHM